MTSAEWAYAWAHDPVGLVAYLMPLAFVILFPVLVWVSDLRRKP